jgi:hypothetical protein
MEVAGQSAAIRPLTRRPEHDKLYLWRAKVCVLARDLDVERPLHRYGRSLPRNGIPTRCHFLSRQVARCRRMYARPDNLWGHSYVPRHSGGHLVVEVQILRQEALAHLAREFATSSGRDVEHRDVRHVGRLARREPSKAGLGRR